MRILIVEDHADSATAMASLLKKLGHDTQIAQTGADALAAIIGNRPDVAMCDVSLPDCDGCELMIRLRDEFGIRCVAVTGHRDAALREKCEAAQIRAIIKPIQLDELLGWINDAAN